MKIITDAVVNVVWIVPDGEYLMVETERLSPNGSVRLSSKCLRNIDEQCESYPSQWETRDNLTTRIRNAWKVTVINNKLNGKSL